MLVGYDLVDLLLMQYLFLFLYRIRSFCASIRDLRQRLKMWFDMASYNMNLASYVSHTSCLKVLYTINVDATTLESSNLCYYFLTFADLHDISPSNLQLVSCTANNDY